jgi:hypothetical protein
MDERGQGKGLSDGARMAILAIGGVIVANVVGALMFDRDTGFGGDDVLYILAGLALAAIVELVFFRRNTRSTDASTGE